MSLPPTNGLNTTEQYAYAWLLQNGVSSIAINRRGTPDFLTDKGGYEVKRICGKNTVRFTPGQREKVIASKSKVLIFRENSQEPEAVLESKDLLQLAGTDGSILEKNGYLLRLFEEGKQDKFTIYLKSKETRLAWNQWVLQCKAKVNFEERVTFEYALDELLREKGLLPQKANVY